VIVVSNTSPLTGLASIGQLDLLRRLYGQVHIPAAVRREVGAWREWPGRKAVLDARWIVTHNVSNVALVAALRTNLDAGEAEAIALASELGSQVVLLDEDEGRRSAECLGLRRTGAVGVLLEAKRKGLVKAVRPLLDDLREGAGFYLSEALYQQALESAGETAPERK
jgi:hypothetical protein